MTESAPIRVLTWALLTAALLWFLMFSPWTSVYIPNFWLAMSISALILTLFAFYGRRQWHNEIHLRFSTIALGIFIAAVLWFVFWLGDKVSSLLFDFARPQVDSIYGLKTGHSAYGIGLLLLVVIGPAEEIFWRGFVQHTLSIRWNANRAFVLTAFLYTFVHIWSFNLMLLLSAMVAGVAWGLLYRLFPRQLGAIILSHALWDCAVFVVFPIL